MVMLREPITSDPEAPYTRQRSQLKGRRESSTSVGSGGEARGDNEDASSVSIICEGSSFNAAFWNYRSPATGNDALPTDRMRTVHEFEVQPARDAENYGVVNSSDSSSDLQASQDQRELFSPPAAASRPTSKLEPAAVRILRKHFVEIIIADLKGIQRNAGKPSSAVYAESLLRTMRQVRDLTSSDPFSAVVVALHDALAYKNRWADYRADQFEQARAIIAKYANQEVFPDKVEKAIMELESAGFDTTPFEVEFAAEEE